MNLRPSGYEPDELPTAPLRDITIRHELSPHKSGTTFKTCFQNTNEPHQVHIPRIRVAKIALFSTLSQNQAVLSNVNAFSAIALVNFDLTIASKALPKELVHHIKPIQNRQNEDLHRYFCMILATFSQE